MGLRKVRWGSERLGEVQFQLTTESILFPLDPCESPRKAESGEGRLEIFPLVSLPFGSQAFKRH